MAGDWTPIDDDLPHKPEIHRVVTATGEHLDTVVGRIVRFWLWVDRHGRDDPGQRGWGLLLGCQPADLARQCGGDADFWAKVSASAPEWLRFERRGALVPGFDKRFSKSAKRRLEDAARKQNKRAEGVLAAMEAPAGAATEVAAASRPKPAKSSGRRCFAAVNAATLCDVHQVVAWVQTAIREGVAGLEDSPETYREVWAAAKYALTAKNPAAMFVQLISQRKWEWITNAARNMAAVEWRTFEAEIRRRQQHRALTEMAERGTASPMVLKIENRRHA